MKNLISLLAACLLLFSTGYTQSVGINNDHSAPHASAMLDVKNPNKGLLIPRVALTGTKEGVTIPSPAISLLVYNTATSTGSTAVTPGFYYWNGAEWIRLSTGFGWLLTGNAGTVDGTNFIGTTDNVPFNIKVNNQKAGRIDLSNTFWGYQAGNSITSGSYNTANGVSALQANQAGTANTAIGTFSLLSNTSGGDNTATGVNALESNLTGRANTAYGVNALVTNSTGNNNTANGYSALQNNTTGYSNVAMGVAALRQNTISSNLVAIGDSALFNNASTYNTAVGSKALYSNTTGNFNTANGAVALNANTSGYSNTANGGNALKFNTEGHNNTAFGTAALPANTMGSQNSATGVATLNYNTIGDYNTANGYTAMYANTEGFRNTAVGAEALYSNLTGSYNSAFGTGANVGFGNLINATAIGANATVNASNTVQIGNSAVTDVYFGNGTATLHANSVITPSDARFKYNIQNNVPGLDFITKLTPVTYYFDEQKLEEYTKTGYINNNIIKPASYNGQKQLHTGFLAQDVEKIAKELGYPFDGVHAPANDKDHYSLAYSQFIMPLVKAVQEQQVIIEKLTRQVEQSQSAIIGKQQQIIDDKQQQIDTLKARLDKLEKILTKQ